MGGAGAGSALAAVVVAAARHVDPALTPDAAVKELKNQPATRAAVRDAIVDRAPRTADRRRHGQRSQT